MNIISQILRYIRLVLVSFFGLSILYSSNTFASENISAGFYHSCGILADQTTSCWGGSYAGEAVNQTGSFIQISAGYQRTCGIQTDNTIKCWGYTLGTTLTGAFIQVDAGYQNHSCGLRSDGSIKCWGGDNIYGQINDQTGSFTQVSVGANHSCGLLTDGSIKCWGSQILNQTGSYLQVDTKTSHTCGLRSDGSIKCWGSNSYGQINDQTGSFTQVSVGANHSCGLLTDGNIKCWGDNSLGQTTYQTGSFLELTAGIGHTCGLKTTGVVTCWGLNSDGQVYGTPLNTFFTPFIFISSNPTNSSIGVSAAQPIISTTFSKSINILTLSGNILLTTSGGISVPHNIVSTGGSILSIQPTSNLGFNTQYTVTYGTGIESVSGATLISPKVLSFTTETLIPPQTLAPILTENCGSSQAVCIYMQGSIDNQSMIYASFQSNDKDNVYLQNIADPITLANGESVYTNTFLHLPGKGISYELSLINRSRASYNGPIGQNWDHNYNRFLRENANGSIDYYNGKLGIYTFTSSGGYYSPNRLLKASLSKSGSIYTINFIDGSKEIYGSNLYISSLQDPIGNSLSFTYDSEAKLTKVTDQNSNEIFYTYFPSGRIQSVSTLGGRSVSFTYDTSYNLIKIDMTNSGNTKTLNYTYSPANADPNLEHNLISFTDAKGQTYVSNTYDSNDRVSSQVYGNGTVFYTYTLSGTSVTKNSVTNRKGVVTEYYYDTFGNNTQMLVKGTGGLSDITYSYTYDSLSQKLTETKPRGNGTKYTYDGSGNILESRIKTNIASPDSATGDLISTYQYDPKGNITQMTSPNGKTSTFTYNTGGKVTKIETTIGSGIISTNNFFYDPNGRITEKRDGENNSIYYEYTNLNIPTKIKVGTGVDQSINTYTYDSYGNPLTITDGEGYTHTYEYDVFDRLIQDTSSEGIVRQYTYDANNNKLSSSLIINGGESVDTSTSYDILDNPTQITQETKNTINNSQNLLYDKNGKVIQKTYQNGLIETYEYDMMERLKSISIIGGKTDTTTYIYDVTGNLLTKIKNGNTATKEYDLYDRMTKNTDALGNYKTYTYDTAGNITLSRAYSSTGLLMQETGYTYDLMSRLTRTSEKRLENSTYRNTLYTYDKNDKKLSETDALSGSTSYTYDSLGRLRSKTLPNGLKYETSYSKTHNILTEKVITGSGTMTTTYTYDHDGRKLSMQDSLGNTTTYTYNKLGQVTQIVDPLLIPTIYTYDYLSNILTETRSGKTITSEYDITGKRTKVTDAGGVITEYLYDPEGRIVEERFGQGGWYTSTFYTYDNSGNLKTKEDSRGTKITYTYDALDRNTRKDIIRGSNVSGPTSETFAYDGLSRLTSTTTQEGWNSTFTYDSLDNLTKDSIGTFTLSSNLQYDILGRVTRMPYTQTIGYANITYDSLGRMTKVTDSASGSYIDYTYNQLSLLREARKNTLGTNYTYDGLARITSISGSGYTSPLSYTYDTAGRITAKGGNTYTYNSQNELMKALYQTGIYTTMSGTSYIYDLMGNKKNESIILSTGSTGETLRTTWNYLTGAQNRYTGVTSSSGLTYSGVYLSGTLISDAVGNITGNQIGSQKQYEFIYDYANRIVQVNKYTTGTTKYPLVSYKYDALGRRVFRQAQSGSLLTERTYYGYYKNTLIEERIESMSGSTDGHYIVKNYIYGPGGDDDIALIVQKYVKKIGATYPATTGYYYFHKDHLSSPEKISNGSGVIIEEYAYSPFGVTYVKNTSTSGSYMPLSRYTSSVMQSIGSGSTGSLWGNNRLYTGREYDRESGLYYMRARHYDSVHSRFMSRDPIGYMDDVNPYRYVGNSPLIYVDRTGTVKMILQETSERLLRWTVEGLLLALSPNTGNSPGEISQTYEADMARGRALDEEILNPSGGALFISMILPVPGGGKKAAGEQVLKDINTIINGHALDHLDEFASLGVKTADDLEKHARGAIENALEKGNVRQLERGRTMVWDETSETIIFRDPGRDDLGTIFKHDELRTKKSFLEYINSQN